MQPELRRRLSEGLAGRYTFERELGRGGTAVVYLASDDKHDRKVALKVLLPQVALAIGAERFQREIAIAAKLSHPHILPLHDSGEVDGLLYYVMPFVQGESLRDRIARKKQLPLDEALRIAVEVASALDRAHRDGVVHRDIKPENILLEGGYAIVADFGIARAKSAAESEYITQTGLAVGTPTYMSPEQAVGAADIDGRSDVYSLGCVLYEMLTGSAPFTGKSLREILMKHSLEAVPSVCALRPDVPGWVDDAIGTALAKEPGDRFQTAADFAAALTAGEMAASRTERSFWGRVRSIFGRPAPVLARTTLSPSFGMPTNTPATLTAGQRPISLPTGSATPLVTTPTGRAPIDSLAVLPFSMMGGDSDGEYLSEGITETIINKLTGVSGLRVVPRSVVFRYKGKDSDPSSVAREVNARAVVTGRMILRGQTLVIKAELVDTMTEAQLWGEQYNRTMSDIFAVQEEMASEITRSLQLKLSGDEEKGMAKRFTENSDAYQAYLRGRYHWGKRTVDGLRNALSHFQQAIDLDPNYALAYTGLADTFNILGYYNNQRPHDAYPKGKAAVQRALAVDESLAEAHASLGYIQIFYDLDWAGARRSFERALALQPKYATTHHWYAWLEFVEGRFDVALQRMQRAHELDPLSLIINDHLGYTMLLAGNPDAALKQLEKTRELDPAFPWTYWRLGDVYFAMGEFDKSIASYREVVDRTNRGVCLGFVGRVAAEAGRADEARAVLAQLEERKATRYASPLEFALVHAGLGEVDECVAALQQAYEERVSDFARLRLLPWPAAVRQDPRYLALAGHLARTSGA